MEFGQRIDGQMMDCNSTAVNNAIRHISTYHRWQSIRVLRESFRYKSLTDMFSTSKRKFSAKLPCHRNSVISPLAIHSPVDVA